MICNL
jgi:peptide chain release factor subunit 3